MNKVEKQVKKLQKVRLWPTILILILTLFVVLAVTASAVSLLSEYILQQKFEGEAKSCEYLGKAAISEIKSGEDPVKVLASFVTPSDATPSAIIVNSERKSIAGFGNDFDPRQYTKSESTESPVTIYYKASLMEVLQQSVSETDVKAQFVSISDAAEDPMFDAEADVSGSDMFVSVTVSNSDFIRKLSDVKMNIGTGWFEYQQDDMALLIEKSMSLTIMDLLFLGGIVIMFLVIIPLPLLVMLISLISAHGKRKDIDKLLYLDTTTGGNNWKYFTGESERLMQRARNAGVTYAVVDYELTRFRRYCAGKGVKAGDLLLEQTSELLDAQMKRGELCARYGKANFAILLRCAGEEDCTARIEQINEAFAQMRGKSRVYAHAGFVLIPPIKGQHTGLPKRRKKVNIAQLYNAAGEARASIEAPGEDGIACVSTEMLEKQNWEHKVEEMFDTALENEEFVVYYQPKYDPASNELVGAEALVRWDSSTERSIIPPGRFIPLLEKNGKIKLVDDYMISHVAKQQAEWIAQGMAIVPVSVNVSRAHFANQDLAEHICRLVDEYGVPHNAIEIELTESAFFDDKEEMLRIVGQLKECGFIVSMDDFGSGYSSLNSLKDLPLDVLKLDADFFRGEDGDGERGEVVISDAIVMAKHLNMRVVAEGVEKAEQVELLTSLGCDMIQGYYYDKPMPSADFGKKLDKAEIIPTEEPETVSTAIPCDEHEENVPADEIAEGSAEAPAEEPAEEDLPDEFAEEPAAEPAEAPAEVSAEEPPEEAEPKPWYSIFTEEGSNSEAAE